MCVWSSLVVSHVVYRWCPEIICNRKPVKKKKKTPPKQKTNKYTGDILHAMCCYVFKWHRVVWGLSTALAEKARLLYPSRKSYILEQKALNIGTPAATPRVGIFLYAAEFFYLSFRINIWHHHNGVRWFGNKFSKSMRVTPIRVLDKRSVTDLFPLSLL